MSVKIHGNEYITVDERVELFHELYPNGMIVTTLLKIENDQIMFRATATPDVEKPERYFTGHAEEIVGSSQINKTSTQTSVFQKGMSKQQKMPAATLKCRQHGLGLPILVLNKALHTNYTALAIGPFVGIPHSIPQA